MSVGHRFSCPACQSNLAITRCGSGCTRTSRTWRKTWTTGSRNSAALPLLELPADRPRPSVCSFQGARKRFSVPQTLVRTLREFSRREAVTLFTVFAAALNTLIFRYTDQERILVGIPLSERDRPELQPMIGFLLHTHVLQTALCGDMSFRQLLFEVQRTVLELYDHRSPPFDRVVSRVSPQRDPGYSPLFQVMINWRDSEQELGFIGLEGLEVESLLAETRTSKFDMTAILTDAGDEIWLELEYSTDLFRRAKDRSSGRPPADTVGGRRVQS